ncbi:MAG: Dihydroxyacetone kinase 2 [Vezdaea aestivalis]|nr:MAG: Dihydroxyacetone kinase 2 [Vezdaea aestivalis]
MGLVIDRPIPYADDELNLRKSKGWVSLLPLFRPSLSIVPLPGGSYLFADRNYSLTGAIPVIVLTCNGESATSVLSKSCVAAFVLLDDKYFAEIRTETDQLALGDEIVRNCTDAGLDTSDGAVLIENGGPNAYRRHPSAPISTLQLAARSEFNHVLDLLNSLSTGTTPISFVDIDRLLCSFGQTSYSTRSYFTDRKSGQFAVVSHAGNEFPFESAAQAVALDIESLEARSKSTAVGNVLTLHISCFNGMSELERLILVNSAAAHLDRHGHVHELSSSMFSDATNGPRGWGISFYVADLGIMPLTSPTSRLLSQDSLSQKLATTRSWPVSEHYDDEDVRRRIVSGCKNLIESEPLVTEYDTILGDGDCGHTLRDGAEKALDFIQGQDLTQLPATLGGLVEALEVTMGGTSGALYCIFLSSLARCLWDAPDLPTALAAALDDLLKFTRARLGDRTMLDCLVPFINTLKATHDPSKALVEATNGRDSTSLMTASVGRSSYLSESTTRNIPDPGAVGLLKLLEGIVEPN